jgi:hypothetical protein
MKVKLLHKAGNIERGAIVEVGGKTGMNDGAARRTAAAQARLLHRCTPSPTRRATPRMSTRAT